MHVCGRIVIQYKIIQKDLNLSSEFKDNMFGFNTILFINFTYSLLRVKLFSRLIQLLQRKLFVIMHFTFHKIYYLFPEESGVCSFVSDALLKHIRTRLFGNIKRGQKRKNNVTLGFQLLLSWFIDT